MKKIIGIIILLIFICTSFYVTDNVIEVMRDDELLDEIKSHVMDNNVDVIEATVNGNTIIPGLVGRTIDIDNSYDNMKKYNEYREDLAIYKIIYPRDLIKDNRDKYIIGGNKNINSVAIVMIMDNDYYKDIIVNIIDYYKININLFVDDDYISNDYDSLYLKLYSYGDKGIYDKNKIVYINNIISNRYNDSIYCLSNMIDNNIEICKNNKMYTIVPSIYDKYDIYGSIKSNLSNGSIIRIDINKSNLDNIGVIIKYIKSKGYNIVFLDELLEEVQ